MSTLKEQIAELLERAGVMEHFENGGAVFSKCSDGGVWRLDPYPAWNNKDLIFRKHVEPPAPREFWISLSLSGSVYGPYKSRKAADESATGHGQSIHMREVMDGESSVTRR